MSVVVGAGWGCDVRSETDGGESCVVEEDERGVLMEDGEVGRPLDMTTELETFEYVGTIVSCDWVWVAILLRNSSSQSDAAPVHITVKVTICAVRGRGQRNVSMKRALNILE